MSARLSIDESKVDAAVNPMFLKQGSELGADGSQDSLIASLLAQREPPSASLWAIFRDEFVAVSAKSKEAVAEASGANALALKLEGVVAAATAQSPPRDARPRSGAPLSSSPAPPAPTPSAAAKTPPFGATVAAYRSPSGVASARVMGMSPVRSRAALPATVVAALSADSDPVHVEGVNPLHSADGSSVL